MTGPTINFGKYRGQPVDQIDDIGYLSWVLSTGSKDPYSRVGEFVETYGDAIRARIRAHYAAAADRYTLTPSQQAVADELCAALVNGDVPAARLDGGAGYGKSFTVAEVARQALLAGYEVNACAPSYVATQVLARSLDGLGVNTRTIASLCHLPKEEQEDRESYVVTEHSHEKMAGLLEPGKLLIVDEWSMGQDEVAEPLIRYTAQGGKLLGVGDRYQLPPVGQRTPSAFSRIETISELTEPMRFGKDSDLYTLEQLARFQPRAIYNHDFGSSSEVVSLDSTIDMFRRFIDDQLSDPLSDHRILFYRRKDVQAANTTVRGLLYGDQASREPVIEDERVMCMRTTDVGQDTRTGADGVRYYSGETFFVEDAEPMEVHGVPCHQVKLHGRQNPVFVVFPGSDTPGAVTYRRTLAALRNAASENGDWREYRAVRDAFFPAGYNYSMTVHRCQGQTVDRVYFCPRHLQGPEGAALTYVAATRARKNVYLAR